jgi:hypothetical protein
VRAGFDVDVKEVSITVSGGVAGIAHGPDNSETGQPFLGKIWGGRQANAGAAALLAIQDHLVERNCGVACGLVYAGVTVAYEGFITDALVAVDEARAGNFREAGIASIFATIKPAKAAKSARGLGSLDDLSRAAGALDRGGLSAAGRQLQKHGSRTGSAFPGARGNPAAINRQAGHRRRGRPFPKFARRRRAPKVRCTTCAAGVLSAGSVNGILSRRWV